MFHLMCGECGSYNVICRGNVLMEVDMRASTERWRIRSLLNIESLTKLKCLDCDYVSNNIWDFAQDDPDQTMNLVENLDNKRTSNLDII